MEALDLKELLSACNLTDADWQQAMQDSWARFTEGSSMPMSQHHIDLHTGSRQKHLQRFPNDPAWAEQWLCARQMNFLLDDCSPTVVAAVLQSADQSLVAWLVAVSISVALRLGGDSITVEYAGFQLFQVLLSMDLKTARVAKDCLDVARIPEPSSLEQLFQSVAKQVINAHALAPTDQLTAVIVAQYHRMMHTDPSPFDHANALELDDAEILEVCASREAFDRFDAEYLGWLFDAYRGRKRRDQSPKRR